MSSSASASSSSASSDAICAYASLGCTWRLREVQYGPDEEANRAASQAAHEATVHHVACCMARTVAMLKKQVSELKEQLAQKDAMLEESLQCIDEQGQESFGLRIKMESGDTARAKHDRNAAATGVHAESKDAASASTNSNVSASSAAAAVPRRASSAAASTSAATSAAFRAATSASSTGDQVSVSVGRSRDAASAAPSLPTKAAAHSRKRPRYASPAADAAVSPRQAAPRRQIAVGGPGAFDCPVAQPHSAASSADMAPALPSVADRKKACMASARAAPASDDMPSHIPFRAAHSVCRLDDPALSSITYRQQTFEVRLVDGHMYVHFSAMFPALQDAGLFPREDPPAHFSLAPTSASSAIKWLMFWQNREFPAGRYASGESYVAGKWGHAFACAVRMLPAARAGSAPEAWLCVHGLETISELTHYEYEAERAAKLASPEWHAFKAAYLHVLQVDLHPCKGCTVALNK